MTHPYPPGARVEKINSKPGDGHGDGARAIILGHVGTLPYDIPAMTGTLAIPAGTYGYFVRWDDAPDIWVAVTGNRVRPISETPSFAEDAHRFLEAHPDCKMLIDRSKKEKPNA